METGVERDEKYGYEIRKIQKKVSEKFIDDRMENLKRGDIIRFKDIPDHEFKVESEPFLTKSLVWGVNATKLEQENETSSDS